MISGPGNFHVEDPLVDQLVSMGWKAATGNLNYPFAAHREAVSAITRLDSQDLMEANRAATRLLLKGTTVEGLSEWNGGRDQTVHYIDWDHPENNTFRVITQFRVDQPGGQPGAYVVPDLVLFVNGIPLVVVECRSPGSLDPVGEAINQLQRYSNQRKWVEEEEGNERLFHYNQIMVATCFEKAVFGTVGARAVDYLEWKDTSPVPMDYVAASLGKEHLSSQEILVAGMLRPELLLEIVRHFTWFREESRKVVKIVPRYQQCRAVRLAVHRLLDGKTVDEDGGSDGRGGIIWHTQGSGKSLTLAFLARKIRSHPELGRFKVVAITNQTDLEPHFLDTAELTESTVEICKDTEHLKRVLAEKGPALVCAMTRGFPSDQGDSDRDVESGVDEGILPVDGEEFPVLNTDDSILLLVDEAHPSCATGSGSPALPSPWGPASGPMRFSARSSTDTLSGSRRMMDLQFPYCMRVEQPKVP
jgi:type I restriction enzyme R subunit